MSLSLLAAYGSDSEDDERQTPTSPLSKPQSKPSLKDSIAASATLFSSLPPPKGGNGRAQRAGLSSSLPAPKQKSTNPTEQVKPKKVQIFVDLPKHPTDDDKDVDDEDARRKRNTVSGSGGGLFAMLPPPKSAPASAATTTSSVKTVSMIPHSLTKKSTVGATATKAVPNNEVASGLQSAAAETSMRKDTMNEKEEESAAEDDGESFFTLDTEEPQWEATDTLGPSIPRPTIGPSTPALSASSQYAFSITAGGHSASQQYAYDPNAGGWDPGYSQYPEEALPDDALKILGHRAKDGPIQIKEINQAQMMDNTWKLEAAKNKSLEKPASMETFRHLAPNKGQKRKHNIMSLAFEAKQREHSLAEMAANRVASKKISQAKYGF
ncbi:hypothetical protein HK104_009739 [Borealophlyctis nickersoniae]|nr:hypothetical protein HK104_009739 [Borealophlyctis nickersoniae]